VSLLSGRLHIERKPSKIACPHLNAKGFYAGWLWNRVLTVHKRQNIGKEKQKTILGYHSLRFGFVLLMDTEPSNRSEPVGYLTKKGRCKTHGDAFEQDILKPKWRSFGRLVHSICWAAWTVQQQLPTCKYIASVRFKRRCAGCCNRSYWPCLV
jgi:hypothetical protein